MGQARVLINDLHDHIDQEVSVSGWVDVRRDHGKLIFLDIRDRSGRVQAVALPNHDGVIEVADRLRNEWVITVSAKVNKRPEKMVNTDESNGDIELELLSIDILSEAAEIPFEKDTDINIDTRFDYRPYTLRSERDQDIFKVQATIVDAYREALHGRGFVDFQAPALVGGDAEGGAEVFKVNYYYEKMANLATSPQLYKQIMVGVYERSFTVAKIFRAEKSATTRHLSELTQLDFEMGFIHDEYDVMQVLEEVVRDTVNKVLEKHASVFERHNIEKPLLGEKFTSITLKEAFEILSLKDMDDLDPEAERNICAWAKEKHGTDFVFITKFPTGARAFYTMDDDTPGLSRGFDLLFRGLEINSGAQRLHNYDELVARISERGMNLENFAFYLQAFKYGMPPHGGCSTGLERFTARMMNLQNVKEAALFPRDINRIDTLLSTDDEI